MEFVITEDLKQLLNNVGTIGSAVSKNSANLIGSAFSSKSGGKKWIPQRFPLLELTCKYRSISTPCISVGILRKWNVLEYHKGKLAGQVAASPQCSELLTFQFFKRQSTNFESKCTFSELVPDSTASRVELHKFSSRVSVKLDRNFSPQICGWKPRFYSPTKTSFS